jgi:hypothetical protein
MSEENQTNYFMTRCQSSFELSCLMTQQGQWSSQVAAAWPSLKQPPAKTGAASRQPLPKERLASLQISLKSREELQIQGHEN